MDRSPAPPIPPELRRRIVRSLLVRGRLVEFVFPDATVRRQLVASLGHVPSDAKRIALIGSGIGWLASELASKRARAAIVGFDPDATSIELASMLFDRPNLSFVVGPGDAAELDGFDVLVMAPGAAPLPGEKGSQKPSVARIVTLAAAGRPPVEEPSASGEVLKVRVDARRSELVTSRLGIHVTSDGYLVARQPGPNVLIVMPERGGYSETFIRAQIERLPATVSLLVGSVPDMTDEGGKELVPWIGRTSREWVGRFFGSGTIKKLDQFWLRRHLTTRHIDVVLGEYGVRGIQMISACQRTSIPLVTHFYGYDGTSRVVFERHEAGYRRLFKRGSPIVVVSHHMASRLTEFGASPPTISVIACGVDPQPGAESPSFADPPVFLAVGRFVEKKAPFLTLLAFGAVVRRAPEARLVMVGDGVLIGACKQLAKALGIETNVDFLGALPHEQLPALYRASRAFVQHSMETDIGDMEGLPVAILEAGAAGLPVIATLHAGIPEAVIEGETGFLVREGGIDEMADRMLALASDRELAERLGTAARRHITTNFALDDSLGRLWTVLRQTFDPSTAAVPGESRVANHGS